MTTRTSLYDLAAELLTEAAVILGTTTSGAPAIQYVSAGPPPLDCCGILTVHAGIITYGPFNAEFGLGDAFDQANRPVIPIVPLTISAFRCATAVPTGGASITLPAAAKMAADASVVYEDAWTLWNGLRQAITSDELFGGSCKAYMSESATIVAPEGGCVGSVVTLVTELEGFQPLG